MENQPQIEGIYKSNLEEMYKAAGGRLSHFLFLTDNPTEFNKELETKGFIKYVKNSEERPMYIITQKLIDSLEQDNEVWCKHPKLNIEINNNTKEVKLISTGSILTNKMHKDGFAYVMYQGVRKIKDLYKETYG